MQAVRGKNTSPELAVRRLVHSMGYRYTLHSQSLPGKPDIVFPSRKKVIFIHGCFWHSHTCRHGIIRPVSNRTYWSAKLERNVLRDRQNVRDLRKAGWKVLVIWECWLKDIAKLTKRLDAFLD
jgi:DNA mismatch endonuclease, patch repair protein